MEKDVLGPAARGGDASPPAMILLTSIAVYQSSLQRQRYAEPDVDGQCCLAVAVANTEKRKHRRGWGEAFIPWLRPLLILTCYEGT